MAIAGLFHSVTALMAVCTKHVSRAAKKLGSQPTVSKLRSPRKRAPVQLLTRGASYIPFLGTRKRGTEGKEDEEEKKSKTSEEEGGRNESEEEEKKEEEEKEEEEEKGVWRRTILMGEKCQPLNFSGVIYYDSKGTQLSEIPTPRSPLRSPRPSFAFHPITVQSEEEAVL